jgi:glutamine synthetase
MTSKYILEYIWLDAQQKCRSKVKIIDNYPILEDLEIWNFDGSSTGQATGKDSEIFIKPYKMFYDWNGRNNYYYIFCECTYHDGSPHITNTRNNTVKYFQNDDVINLETMFGIEQEFFVFKDGKPLIWNDINTEPQGDYYCGNGAKSIKGREYLDEVVDVLNRWDINITGYNFEVAPGQMEIQICEKGIDAADNLIASRFILTRLAEKRGWDIDITPKPEFLGTDKWNGSGCHVNFSTKGIRNTSLTNPLSSLYEVAALMTVMNNNHKHDIKFYGSENNKLRLGGKNETSSYDTFTYGIANRGCSIRIPRTFIKNLKGYIEDRRPGSDMDPYIVTQLITEYVFKPPIYEMLEQIKNEILDANSKS